MLWRPLAVLVVGIAYVVMMIPVSRWLAGSPGLLPRAFRSPRRIIVLSVIVWTAILLERTADEVALGYYQVASHVQAGVAALLVGLVLLGIVATAIVRRRPPSGSPRAGTPSSPQDT